MDNFILFELLKKKTLFFLIKLDLNFDVLLFHFNYLDVDLRKNISIATF